MGITLANMALLGAAGWVPRSLDVPGPFKPEAVWIGIWVAGLLTLAMYSFLYKDNPVYQFAEHLYVGLTVGYFIVLEWFQVMYPNLVVPLATDFGFYWFLIIPGLLGCTMLFRFSRSLSWVSRYALAFMVALGAGLAIPAIIQAFILKHMLATFQPLWTMPPGMKTLDMLQQNFSSIIIFIAVLSVLIYFFFSLEHKGTVGKISQVGIFFLMISFGASFGYTVMARISLLIGRMQFILMDWMRLKIG